MAFKNTFPKEGKKWDNFSFGVQSTDLGGTQGSGVVADWGSKFQSKIQSSGCLCISRRVPCSREHVLHWEDSIDCTGTLITMQQLPQLLLHLSSLSLALTLCFPVDTPSLLLSFSLLFSPQSHSACWLRKVKHRADKMLQRQSNTRKLKTVTPRHLRITGVLPPSIWFTNMGRNPNLLYSSPEEERTLLAVWCWTIWPLWLPALPFTLSPLLLFHLQSSVLFFFLMFFCLSDRSLCFVLLGSSSAIQHATLFRLLYRRSPSFHSPLSSAPSLPLAPLSVLSVLLVL